MSFGGRYGASGIREAVGFCVLSDRDFTKPSALGYNVDRMPTAIMVEGFAVRINIVEDGEGPLFMSSRASRISHSIASRRRQSHDDGRSRKNDVRGGAASRSDRPRLPTNLLGGMEKMAPIKQQRETTIAELEAARERGKVEMALGATAARYDRRRDAVILMMRSGAEATIPRVLIPVVADAGPRTAADVELSPLGTSLRFPRIDADFAVQGLIRRAFGVNEVNRIAGATKSPARAAASRANGLKGGRPAAKVKAR